MGGRKRKMNSNNLLQIGVYFIVLLATTPPLGRFMARVFTGDLPKWIRWLKPLETAVYRICGIDEHEEMTWKGYAGAMLLFNMAGLLAVYGMQRLQQHLPFNPMGMGPVTPDSSWNTAVSFITNTNWQ